MASRLLRKLICSVMICWSFQGQAALFPDLTCGFLKGVFSGKRSEAESKQDIEDAKAGLEKLIEPSEAGIEYDPYSA